MRPLALLILVLASQAFAGEAVKRKVTVNFIGDHSGNRIYYRCDMARDILETHLTKLGATNIQTSCSGGLERYGYSPCWAPMTVSAKFEISTPRDIKEVVVLDAHDRAHEDCFLNVAMMKELLPLIPEAKVLKKRDRCATNETPWSVTVEI